MNKRVIANSKEFFSRESNGHTSVAYSRIGIRFALNRVSTVSSEAVLNHTSDLLTICSDPLTVSLIVP
jgi:hypothetical protein